MFNHVSELRTFKFDLVVKHNAIRIECEYHPYAFKIMKQLREELKKKDFSLTDLTFAVSHNKGYFTINEPNEVCQILKYQIAKFINSQRCSGCICEEVGLVTRSELNY